MAKVTTLDVEWKSIETAPENELVLTKIDKEPGGVRNVTELRFHRNLWWFPDMSMYVYYTPTHWCKTVKQDS